jgi:flagellar biosynthetic protein FlhB
MADEDKQFEASPQKLKKAREQGQVIKSKDMSTAVFILVMFNVLFGLSKFIWSSFAELFIQIFDQIPNKTIDNIGWQFLTMLALKAIVIIVAPFLLIGVLVAFVTEIAQVGPLFTTKTLEPKFDKLNPVKGIKNLFTSRNLIELIKNIIKLIVLGTVGYMVFKDFFPQIVGSGQTENIFTVLAILGEVIQKFIMMVGMAFFIIGGGDYMFQRWKFLKDQKMSMKEMKDEYKQSEGDPMVKAQLRQKRMQMMQQRMLEAVPSADVVTTNPIHIAVALKYNAETMEAPRVVAKGTELFAERIKTIARDHGIPVVENPEVARTLFRVVDVDQEVPPDLYQVVAEILLFAWKLRGTPVPAPLERPKSEPQGPSAGGSFPPRPPAGPSNPI